MSDYIISAKNIYKKFENVEVLKGCDLDIKPTEILSIVGRSGAGKSTLLQILGTLEKPDQGQLIYEGKNIDKLKGNALASFRNKHIGFVFQFHHLLPEFTAEENVALPALLNNVSKKEALERARFLLEKVDLADRATHKPSQLSGGEQQRVAVMRTLMNQPKVVFADEPSGNLDTKHANDLHELFFKLRDEFKQTFVIVTHNTTLANMADRKIEIRDGKIV